MLFTYETRKVYTNETPWKLDINDFSKWEALTDPGHYQGDHRTSHQRSGRMEQQPPLQDSKPSSLTPGSLLAQCQELHTSVLAFRNTATAQYTPVELGSYMKSLVSELKVLERLATVAESSNSTYEDEDVGSDTDRIKHTLRSSNLRFLTTVWNMARRCRNVIALSRREYVGGTGGHGGKGVIVDVVADMGLLWIKIVTIGERKLLFDIAKEGWDEIWDESDSEASNDTETAPNPSRLNGSGVSDSTAGSVQTNQTDSGLPLVKMVKDIVSVTRTTKIRYRHPELLVYFPNFEENKLSAPVAKVIAMLRATGATIHCGTGDIELANLPSLPQQNSDSFELMLPRTLPDLTPVLNIDCTILLALISDLSHLHLDEHDAHNEPLKRQLAGERARPLLPEILYPALAGRKLITSDLAAQRMWEIVNTLGTPGEKARADILFQQGPFASSDRIEKDLIDCLQEHSDHNVPAELRLPIEIINEVETKDNNAPQELLVLQPILSDINWSVTVLGWSRKVTTVTSNRAAAKQIEHMMQKLPEGILGPDIWVVDIACSLVGKERKRGPRET